VSQLRSKSPKKPRGPRCSIADPGGPHRWAQSGPLDTFCGKDGSPGNLAAMGQLMEAGTFSLSRTATRLLLSSNSFPLYKLPSTDR
jgi:hypothetical protein